MASEGEAAAHYTTDEALTRVGFGRFQALLLVFLGTGSVAEAMETMLLSFVGPPVKAEWGISAAEEGLVTSVVFVGTVMGACVGGLGSDSYGRRLGVLVIALVTSISGFLCSFSPNYLTLLALRFLVGLGLGASHVLSIWFLEFVPAENRGSWMAGFSCFWSIGTILEALLAWGVMPILGWRWLLALTSSPYFILLIFSCLIPESPRYLCSRGKINEATLVLERIAGMNNRALPPGVLVSNSKGRADNDVDSSVATLLLMPEDGPGTDENISSKSHSTNAFQAIWSRDLIFSTLLLWLVKFACFFAYYGIILLTSKLSNAKQSCASVGHMMQPKESSLYTNVLVTSFAGVGIANCIGQVGSIVAPLVTVTLVENCRQKEAVFVIDLLLFLAGVACALFPLSTKGREIQ